jgi:hypothetical protein
MKVMKTFAEAAALEESEAEAEAEADLGGWITLPLK